ncbi:MAG: Vgb family protein [Vulcanimicrobiaceae bacterium]
MLPQGLGTKSASYSALNIPVKVVTLQSSSMRAINPKSTVRVTIGKPHFRPMTVGPASGSLETDLSQVGNLHNPLALALAGSTLWVGSNSSNLLTSISTPADTYTSYSLSSGHNVAGIAVDSSGRPWFSDPGATSVGYIATGSSSVTEYSLGSAYGTNITGAVKGPDGNIYFGSAGYIMEASTLSPGSFSYVTVTGYSPKYAAAGPDGTLWFTSNGKVVQLVFSGTTLSAVNAYTITSSTDTFGAIAKGDDNNMYIADQTADSLIEIVLNSSGTPTSTSTITGFPGAIGGLAAGQYGDTDMWFTIPSANEVFAINTASSTVDLALTAPSSSAAPTSVATTPDDSIWWGETATGFVGTYGDPQEDGALYIDQTNLRRSGVPVGPGYSAGYAVVSPHGSSLTGVENNCLGYSYGTTYSFPSGVNDVGLTTTNQFSDSGTCYIIMESTYGEGEFYMPE